MTGRHGRMTRKPSLPTIGIMLTLLAQATHAQEPARSMDGAGDPFTVRWAFVTHGLATRHRERAAAFTGPLSQALGGHPCRTTVALGSYPDVAVWIARESVDLALLPAVAYAAIKDDPHLRTVAATEQAVPFGLETPHARRHYRATAIVRQDSVLHQAYLLALKAQTEKPSQGLPLQALAPSLAKAVVLAVDPMSASGFLAPLAALKSQGIEIPRERIHLTFSHSRALQVLQGSAQLIEGPAPKVEGLEHAIAFVSEDAWHQNHTRYAGKLVALTFQELHDTPIPGEALVAPVSFLVRLAQAAGQPPEAATGLALLRKALSVDEVPPAPVAAALRGLALTSFCSPDDGDYDTFLESRLDSVFGTQRLRPQNLRSSARDLVEQITALRQQARQHGEPPKRVALVLSGGGNKCAFEAGVLSKLYAEGFRPDVVVGTSGGALNSLATALGFAEPDLAAPANIRGIREPVLLEQLWLDLRRGDVIPATSAFSLLALSILGCSFVGLVAFLQLLLLGRRYRLAPNGRMVATATPSGDEPEPGLPLLRAIIAWCLSGGCLAIGGWAAIDMAFPQIFDMRWGPLDSLRLGLILFSLPSAIRFGCLGVAANSVGADESTNLSPGRRLSYRLLRLDIRLAVASVAAVVLLGLIISAFRASELVPTWGVRNTLTRRLMEALPESDRSLPRPDSLTPAQWASQASALKRRLRSDLVLTVTPFGGAALDKVVEDRSTLEDEELRSHYKWFPRDPTELRALRQAANEGTASTATATDTRPRWLEPLEYKHMVDVATASGALFPLFGLHPIEIDGRVGRYIDGGYAHNIPVEAARLWGASIIVVIRASPEAIQSEGGHALGNLLAAIDVLYERAQRLDSPHGHRIKVFQATPTETYGILTFHPDDLAKAILDGRRSVARPAYAGEKGFAEVAHETPSFD